MSDALKRLDERERFRITWDGGAYRVSIPRYEGGEVVTAEAYERMERIVRDVVDAPCQCAWGADGILINGYCHRCRIRRELSGGVRAQASAPAVSIKSESWLCIPHQYEGETACPKCEIERGVR